MKTVFFVFLSHFVAFGLKICKKWLLKWYLQKYFYKNAMWVSNTAELNWFQIRWKVAKISWKVAMLVLPHLKSFRSTRWRSCHSYTVSTWRPPWQEGCWGPQSGSWWCWCHHICRYVPDDLLDERVVGVHKAEGGDIGAAICTWRPPGREGCWGPQGGRRWYWCRHICTYVPDHLHD